MESLIIQIGITCLNVYYLIILKISKEGAEGQLRDSFTIAKTKGCII